MVKIVGDTPIIKRVITGLYTFDRAFENSRGDIGFPVGTITEISGPTGCGKSTLTYGLSAILGKITESDIALSDFEGFDPEFMSEVMEHSGFEGTVYHIQKEKDEESLDELLERMKEGCSVGIIDSIGAISPISELEGDLGEANMGRRAKLVAQFVRKSAHEVKTNRSKSIFMINHVHSNIGGFGSVTPGGETMKYLSAVRISVKRKEEFPDQSYVLEGKVRKNRFGYKDRQFYIFMLSGKGIHIGLTAMYECLLSDKAERTRNIIKIGGESQGHLKDLVQAGHDGDDEKFAVFRDLLS